MLGPSGLPVATLSLWPADASQKTEHTMRTALLEKCKNNFSLVVLLSQMRSYVEGAVLLCTDLMAPAALPASENIYILVILFVILEINFWWKEPCRRTWKKSKFLFSIKKKIRYEHLYSTLFYKLTYLLLCSKLSFVWGSSGDWPICGVLCNTTACLPRLSLPGQHTEVAEYQMKPTLGS